MHVNVIERAPATIAGLRYVGPYGEPVGRFWLDEYLPWAVANGLGPDHARYGIARDDPDLAPAHICRYDACAEVAPGELPAGATVTATIPGGRHAVFDFHGTAADIGAAWGKLRHEWLPASGLSAAGSRTCFEYYPQGGHVDPDTGAFSCQLCIPLAGP